MRIHLIVALAVSLCACKKQLPAGTAVVDWMYTPSTPVDSVPSSLSPAKTVTEDATWPLAKGSPIQLRFETEIGEQLVEKMRWHTPRHVHVSLAQPTSAALPTVNCMPAPPGNKVQDGHLVPPVGRDGTTPIGRVACFFTAQADTFVFDIDGDGHVTGSVPRK